MSLPILADTETKHSVAAMALPEKLGVHYLPNAYRITSNIISGGLPEGDVAFQELQELGVKTIISVDGMRPDVELAQKYGQRYVHLPHGYDGIPPQRAHELAKAITELPGPIYIHCHHGKHRSPTAAAVACIEAGFMPASVAESILKAAGTGQNYRGLWDSARRATRLTPEFIAQLKVDFVDVASVPPFAQAMVEMEHTFDRLKQTAAHDWRASAKSPDLAPSHEALILKEQFAEMRRLPALQTYPTHFQQYLEKSEQFTQTLEDALRDNSPSRANAAMAAITTTCIACHHEYRDAPRANEPK
ncbi:protein-tyrosine phosphatase family protein [Schlesneria paludicola]|uniref:cytochrome c n=1 Tax=Schlesneria paludicola TaxID=360056 RepID=UPI00029A388A|nr:cytochrome c [Schlesneria paludicola]